MQKLIFITLILAIAGCSSKGAFVQYASPDEKFIDIYGSIQSPLIYEIRVEYRTHSSASQCTNYHISLGRDVAQKYNISYKPEINGETHSIRVPLQAVDPNTICKWKPVMAFVCAGSSTSKASSCTSVYSFRGVHDIGATTVLECHENSFCISSTSNKGRGAIDEFNKKYQLDMVVKSNTSI